MRRRKYVLRITRSCLVGARQESQVRVVETRMREGVRRRFDTCICGKPRILPAKIETDTRKVFQTSITVGIRGRRRTTHTDRVSTCLYTCICTGIHT